MEQNESDYGMSMFGNDAIIEAMHSSTALTAQNASTSAPVSNAEQFSASNPEPEQRRKQSLDIFAKTLHLSISQKADKYSPQSLPPYSISDEVLKSILSQTSTEIDLLSQKLSQTSTQ